MEVIQMEKEKRMTRIAAGDYFAADAFSNIRAILAPGFSVPESMNIVRTAQKTVGSILSSRLFFGSEVCGFRYNSGTYDGLRRILEPFYHRKIERIASVYQLDIKNFFPSVTEQMASDGLANIFSLMKPAVQADAQTLKATAKLLTKTGCYQ